MEGEGKDKTEEEFKFPLSKNSNLDDEKIQKDIWSIIDEDDFEVSAFSQVKSPPEGSNIDSFKKDNIKNP